jgi:hypothetical protein
MRNPRATAVTDRLAAEAAAAPFEDQLWSALELGGRTHGQQAHGLPVARLVVPQRRTSAHYVITSVDVWGRLADRSALQVLRWRPGLHLVVSVVRRQVIVISPQDSGRTNVITRQGHLRLPVAVRQVCRLRAGDRLLLMTWPNRGLLVAYTMAAVDAMVLAFHSHLADQAPP